jgi:non-ribosomal peptide synthetase component F/acyl carrier protein
MTTDGVHLSTSRADLLAGLLRAEGIERSTTGRVTPRPDPFAPVPLSFSQSRLWFLNRFSPDSSAFVIPSALLVHGDFRPDVFARACDELVRRHESLRTVFRDVDGQPAQLVRAHLPPEVTFVGQLGSEVLAEVPAELQRRATALARRPFDLGTGPLVRFELVQISADTSAVLLAMHHIVADLWSLAVLVRDLVRDYTALAAGLPVSASRLAVQYPDFAAWQREPANLASWERDLSYWRRHLAGIPLDVGLATDRPRPAEKTYRGASVPVDLSPTVVAGLRDLARAEHTTLFTVLVAAFTVLVHRLSDADDIVVGTPTANRPLAELEPLIGFFINTLALRTTMTDAATFRSVLSDLKRTCAEAYEHQTLPFERLVEELAPERSLARTPLFQVMLAYRNMPIPELSDGPLRVEPLPLESHKAEFDLLLDLMEDDDTVRGYLEYSLDLFEESSARRIVRVFQRLIRALIADPDQRVDELALMTTDERRRIAGVGRGPDRPWTGTGLVHECVRAHADAMPSAPAVRMADEPAGVVTYADLDRRANWLAHRLRTLAVGPDVLVGVCLRASADLVVSLLAVWKAGGAVVPLDPRDSPARLAYLVRDSGIQIVVVGAGTPVDLPTVSHVVDVADEHADDSRDCPETTVDGQSLAYVSYPPAPDGPPDGLLITHAGLRHEVMCQYDADALDHTDQTPRPVSWSDEAAIREIARSLMTGAVLVIPAERDHHPHDDTLPPRSRDGWFRRSYAGLPVPNTRSYVMDRRRELVPVGVVGELYLSGTHLPRGYLNRPELTAERFIVSQIDPQGPPVRLFRPGELARLRDDGTVELLGRTDRQVVLRGVRISLDEVESALRGYPGVEDVVAAVREVEDEGRLVAYLTGDPGLSTVDLSVHMRHMVPERLAPAAIVVVSTIPLTPAGTVDLAELPAPPSAEAAVPGRWAAFAAPRDEMERSVARLWAELLDVADVGVHDDFFELGGHSMLATTLASRITDAYGIELPIRDLFENPTVAELATWIGERRTHLRRVDHTITPVDRAGPLPLSFAQEYLCLHHPFGPEHAIHNVVTGVRLTGPLDVAALQEALTDVVMRHDALRTRIVSGSAGPAQRVVSAGTWPCELVDLRAVPRRAQRERMDAILAAQATRPMRIDEGPLHRAVLVSLASDEHALILVLHHLVTDNWSYGVLIRDLGELYRARRTATAPRLPDLPIQYPDYAAWQRGERDRGAFDAQLAFWRDELADLPELRLSVSTPDSVVPATGHARSFVLPSEVATRLTGLAREEGTTVFTVLLAAFCVLLSAYSGSDDVPVNFPDAGRDRPETVDLVGFFVNILLIRADLAGSPTFREAVSRVRDRVHAAYANRSVSPYAIGPDPDTGPHRSRIRFNLLNAPLPAVDLDGLVVESLAIGNGFVFSELRMGDVAPAEVDLALVMREHDTGLLGTWLYALDRLDARALSSMMDRWGPLLDLIAANPDRDLTALRSTAAP